MGRRKDAALGWKSDDLLVLDYDDTPFNDVVEDVKRLQETYSLGPANVYRSSEQSYHVYFFEDNTMDRNQQLQVINDAQVDEEFKDFQNDRDETRMRVQGKHDEEIQLVDVIGSERSGTGNKQKAEGLKRTFHRMKKMNP